MFTNIFIRMSPWHYLNTHSVKICIYTLEVSLTKGRNCYFCKGCIV